MTFGLWLIFSGVSILVLYTLIFVVLFIFSTIVRKNQSARYKIDSFMLKFLNLFLYYGICIILILISAGCLIEGFIELCQ